MKKKGQAKVKGEDEDGLEGSERSLGPEPLWPTLPHPPQAQIKGVTGEEHGGLMAAQSSFQHLDQDTKAISISNGLKVEFESNRTWNED